LLAKYIYEGNPARKHKLQELFERKIMIFQSLLPIRISLRKDYDIPELVLHLNKDHLVQ
jgi:hypothetical protein